ncbi:MAG: HDOD domain-containing protein [Nitrospira sp.]|nr:HDOD domain-containing protein [Nitrospira sp.]
MTPSGTATESALIDSIRLRLHPNLRPLFDESSRCLPILQSTCQHILNDMGPHASPAKLAQVISRDHGLTCKVLQVANCIAYSPQQTIVSVSHAVSWLGLDTVRSLVAAAHLVEQLHHWPIRQKEFQTLIAKSLISATYASELATAMDYPQPGQLFTAALLYSIGDLAIAYQDPDLFLALQTSARKVTRTEDSLLEEIRLLGVPRLALAQALAHMWKLPDDLIRLFGSPGELPRGRWQSGFQTYHGIIIGSTKLVTVTIGPAPQTAIEETKRMLLVGSGLAPGLFADVALRAMDRGRQLVRSMGLALDPSDEAMVPSTEHDTLEPIPPPSPATQTGCGEESRAPHQSPIPEDTPAAPIRMKPLETLHAFQDSLQEAKDLNSLLRAFATSLHQDAGFDRVGLSILNSNDSDLLVGRLVLGATPLKPYLQAISGSLSQEHQFFLTVLKRIDPLHIPDFSALMAGTIKREFLETWNPTSGIIASLRVGVKPIGLVYCDRATNRQPIHAQDYQIFQLFFLHTTLAEPTGRHHLAASCQINPFLLTSRFNTDAMRESPALFCFE